MLFDQNHPTNINMEFTEVVDTVVLTPEPNTFDVRSPAWYRFIGIIFDAKIYILDKALETTENKLGINAVEYTDILQRHAGILRRFLSDEDDVDSVRLAIDGPPIKRTLAMNEAFLYMISCYGKIPDLYQKIDETLLVHMGKAKDKYQNKPDELVYQTSRLEEVLALNRAFYDAYCLSTYKRTPIDLVTEFSRRDQVSLYGVNYDVEVASITVN
jgi:hypothetical protein